MFDLDLTEDERRDMDTVTQAQSQKYQRQLRSNRNKTFAITLIRTLHNQIDTQAKQAIAERGIQFDCRPGCDHCCSLRVEVLPPEVFLIARELKKLPKDDLASLVSKIEDQADYARGLSMGNYRRPCVMLEDGRCSIYEVRPSMCRKLYSLDVKSCNTPAMNALEDSRLFATIASITIGANEGYGKAKLPNYSHEFAQALLVALSDKDAEDRWYKGEHIFPMLPDQIN